MTIALTAVILASTHSLSLDDGRRVELDLPDGWSEIPTDQPLPTLELERQEPRAKLLVSVIPAQSDPAAAARRALDGIQPRALEPRLELEPFTGMKGFWFTASDRDWKPQNPDDFRVLDSGVLTVGGVSVVFTVLRDGEPVEEAFEGLRTLRVIASETLRFWKLSVELPPLGRREETATTFRANAGRTNVSIFVEPPHAAGKRHEDVATYYWRLSAMNPLIVAKTVKRTRTPRFTKVAYDVEARVKGQRVTQRNANYFLACDGQWVDVHLSVVEPGAGDERIFLRADESLSCDSR